MTAMLHEYVFTIQNSTAQYGIGGPRAASGVARNISEKERKIGHRRVGVGGEITYKKVWLFSLTDLYEE